MRETRALTNETSNLETLNFGNLRDCTPRDTLPPTPILARPLPTRVTIYGLMEVVFI